MKKKTENLKNNENRIYKIGRKSKWNTLKILKN